MTADPIPFPPTQDDLAAGQRARCKAKVWKRDQYRVRRGHGVYLHYNYVQCARQARDGDDVCWQHARMWERMGRREMLRAALA